ncbi:hypothetical protein ACFV4G_39615 [Kitasatospora sp. NPDC059747]|uniref:hypothetical protein n=1 Tax=Kitasatospora sp. NPDC059747 TaxID=3346930 RepID=UPI003665C072
MTAADEAREIVGQLIGRGFTQTDVARGLGLTAKGSGSYITQVLKGTKRTGKLTELRQLLAAASSAKEVPAGRSRAATVQRQQILTGAAVQRTPRQTKAGTTAAVRKATAEVGRTGYLTVTCAQQSLNGPSGGKPIADALAAYAQYNGRVAFTVVGLFDKRQGATFDEKYWTPYYGKHKRKAARKSGSANVRECTLGNRGRGFAAADWAAYVEAAGTFTAALREWMGVAGYDVPTRFIRVVMDGWLPA